MIRRARASAAVIAAIAAVALGCAAIALGEQSQKGNLVVFLDGGLSPLALPRDRPAPVAVHLEGGLRTADRGPLPRVARMELGLPSQGVLSTRGLPSCRQRLLQDAKPQEAMVACRPALVGHGRLQAQISLPNQDPITVDARVLAFNARVAGGRGVLLHAFSVDPPTAAVLPLQLRRQRGRLGLALVGDLSAALGPWPRLRRFDLTLFRRYSYRGRPRSYLSASCPIPEGNTAAFFSFARVAFTLADGREIGTTATRGCRAR